jgi:cytidine deaminase
VAIRPLTTDMSPEKKLAKISIMEKNTLRDAAFAAMNLAQARVSNIRVGAAVLAYNREGQSSIFPACNLEISYSRAFHAENVALLKALSSGYTDVRAIAVTSDKITKQGAAMCGCCRQDYMYLNPYCLIYVFSADRSLRLKVKLIDTMKFPYLTKRMIK